MDFEFTEEQMMFREAIENFAKDEIAPLVDEAEKNEEFPVQLLPKMGELGYLCPGYPVEIGGGGLGLVGDCIAVESICHFGCDGIGASLMIISGVGTIGIYAHGTEAQKQDYLLPAIKGQKICGLGLTEANHGSDAVAIETSYKREGDKFVINGSKLWTTNGPICDYAIIIATVDRSKGARGISMFIVDKDSPGLSRMKLHKFADHSASTGELIFDNCIISEENLVGEEGKGFRYVMETLDQTRISHSSRSLGTAEAAFDAALEYAKEREAFGQPIAQFQAIAFKLATMAMEIEAARWLTYHAAWLRDQGKPYSKEASMCKLFNSEMGQRMVSETMQILASGAILEDSKVNRYYRDSRIFTITEGSSEIQRIVIARQLGIPLKMR
jgi:alkylation response protein AidB-like acyl-CoA dehydrogenase